MKKIIQIGDEHLRVMSEAVPEPHITDKETIQLLKDLDEALASQDDGVAISAPQIGINKRVFIVAGKVFDEEYMKGDSERPNKEIKNLYFINPEVIKLSKTQVVMEEGCLSIRGVYGNVKRPKNTVIKYFDADGQELERGAGGLLARIFQHEIDHLDGVLFIDKAFETWQDDTYKEKN